MSEPDQPDENLIEQLRTGFAAEPVPVRVTEAAKAALSWRRVDAELAELLSDSAVEAEPALARGGAVVRSVSFSAGETIVELEVHPDGARRTLLGQLSPAARRPITVQQADGSDAASVLSDELGRFRITLAGGGTVRLRIVDDQAGTAIETAWIPI